MPKSNRRKEQLKKRLLKAAKARSERWGLPAPGEVLLARQYDAAVEAWESGDRREALDKLRALDKQFPRNETVLRALTAWSQQLGDNTSQLAYCRKLVEATPDNPEVWYYLGEAHLKCLQPVLARRAIRTAVSRWPDHELVEGGRELLAKIERLLPGALTYVQDLSEAERWELAEAHEQIMVDTQAGRFAQVADAAARLLARWPMFVPARNNAAEAQFHLGRLPEAIAIARETVRLFPDNAYALASLIRFLTLGDRADEGLQLVDQLRSMPPHNSDHVLCSLQTYALLGLDEALLEAWRNVEPESDFGDADKEAMCRHLIAVAACHVGQFSLARQLWESALEICPTLSLAAENLEDLDRPESDRHGAWPFDVAFWTDRWLADQVSTIVASSRRRDESRRRLQQLLQNRPTLVPLFRLMLRRGGPLACKFVFSLAKDLGDSPLVEPLRQFACGQFGSRRLRMEVLSWLQQQGFLDGGLQRVWLNGEWHEIRLSQMEIHREPTGNHSPDVAQLAGRAFELINRDPRAAERLLREALAKEPDAPDLLNNLAAALLGQGRESEYVAIMRDIQRRFPDYLFGQVALAHEQIAVGDLEAARKTLGKLTQRSKVHVSEYAAMAECFIRIAVESDNIEEATSWLQRIESVHPDYHALGNIRRAVAQLTTQSGGNGLSKEAKFPGGIRRLGRRE